MPRNSSGAFALVAGNPVVPDTLIETAWANPTLSDIAGALTDSLDRYGRGSMLAPMRFTDGTLTAPGIAFSAESSSGFWRKGSHSIGVAVAGIDVATFTDTGITLAKPVALNGATFTDPAGFQPGTPAAPGLYVVGDPGTGLYQAAAGQLGISAAGAAAGVFDATGLTLVKSLSMPSTEKVQIGANSLTATDGVGLDLVSPTAVRAFTAGAERWRTNADGNLLVGTTAAAWGAAAGRGQVEINGSASALLGMDVAGAQAGYLYATASLMSLLAAGARDMLFSTNGTERMRIDNGGNIGMGGMGASRGRRLEINSTPYAASSEGGIKLWSSAVEGAPGLSTEWILGANAVGIPYTSFRTGPDGNSYMTFCTGAGQAERVRIDASGNVGIGTVGPRDALEIRRDSAVATVTAQPFIQLCNRTIGYNGIVGGILSSPFRDVADPAYAAGIWFVKANVANVTSNVELALGAGAAQGGGALPTERMRIDAVGSVAIGGASAFGNRLAVLGGSVAIINPYPGAGATPANQAMFFASIPIAGTPQAHCGIQSQYNRIADSDYGSSLLFFTALDNTPLERMRIDNNGNVGIPTALSAYKFALAGASLNATMLCDNLTAGIGNALSILFTRNGVTCGYIQVAGTSTGYITSSDRRLKTAIVDLPDQGATIDALRPREFEWKVAPGVKAQGFIAQELAEYVPECVAIGDDDEEDEVTRPWGTDVAKLMPVVVRELQSLRARVAALEV